MGAFLLQGCDWGGRTGRAGMGAALLAVALPLALLRWGPALAPGWGRTPEAGVTALLALLLVPAAGHAVRRLNDLGWRAGWAWLLLVPLIRIVLAALLVALPPGQRRARAWGPGLILGPAAAGVVALVVLGGLLWTVIPMTAPDMAPTLRPGDLLLVRRAPLAFERGDVVVARAGDGAAPRVGRLVARGGERLALAGGVPVVDGIPARQEPDGLHAEPFVRQGPGAVLPVCGNGAVGLGGSCETRRLREALPGEDRAHAVLNARAGPGDEMAEVLVPPGQLYLLGDHRDAARDSRIARDAGGVGLVPEAEVIGRVALVLASTGAARAWDLRGWRPGRLLERVE